VNVFDASALLAFLQGENGAKTVERELETGGACSAANWSETAQRVLAQNRDWSLARALLLSYELEIAPVTIEDAESAARAWRSGNGLSLGDRLCIALGDRLDATVWTADTAWGRTGRIRQIR
jgi:ribonuclease VapC